MTPTRRYVLRKLRTTRDDRCVVKSLVTGMRMASFNRSSAVYEISISDDAEASYKTVTRPTCRQKCAQRLDHPVVHLFIVMATVVSVVGVTALLLLRLDVIQDPVQSGHEASNTTAVLTLNERLVLAERIIYVAVAALFAWFVFEIAVRVLVRGLRIVCDIWQIFDGVVVMATCIVYVCLTVVLNEHVLAYSLSYVIVLRLWRLGRLYHQVETGARQQALSEFFSLIEGRDLLLTHADKQIRQLRRKLTEKQNFIDQQKQLIAKLRSVASKSLPNNLSFTYSQPTHRSGPSPATAVAEEVSVPNQRLPDTSLPDRDQVGLTSDHPRASESSTASSATDHDRQEPKTAAADQPGGNGTSDGDTDTVSATMWFDRPEIATSFVTCDASDDDDAESVNSNHNENGSGEGIYSYINHGYDEQLTAEEVSEMVRISQVPFTQFSSTANRSNEGIPMTEL